MVKFMIVEIKVEIKIKKNARLFPMEVQIHVYVSLQLLMQNAVSAQPCVGKLQISLSTDIFGL